MIYFGVAFLFYTVLGYFFRKNGSDFSLQEKNNLLLALFAGVFAIGLLLNDFHRFSATYLFDTFLVVDRIFGKYSLVYTGLYLLSFFLSFLFILPRLRRGTWWSVFIISLLTALLALHFGIQDPSMHFYSTAIPPTWLAGYLGNLPLALALGLVVGLWGGSLWALNSVFFNNSNQFQ